MTESTAEEPQVAQAGVDFRLSRNKAAMHLIWTACAGGFMLLAWLSGKIDAFFLAAGGAVVLLIIVFNLLDASKAGQDRSVKLRIGPDGIDMPDRFQGTMPWTGIEKLSRDTDDGGTLLYVVPKHPTSYGIAPTSGRLTFFSSKGACCNISELEGSPADVFTAIRRFAPAQLSKGL